MDSGQSDGSPLNSKLNNEQDSISTTPKSTTTTSSSIKPPRLNHPGQMKLPLPSTLPFQLNSSLPTSPLLLSPTSNPTSHPNFPNFMSPTSEFPPSLTPNSPSALSNNSSCLDYNDHSTANTSAHSNKVRRYPMRNVMYPIKLGSKTANSTTSHPSEMEVDHSTTEGHRRNSLDTDGLSDKMLDLSLTGGESGKGRETRSGSIYSEPFLMTKRFEHTVLADGGNFIVTGREGDITACEEEVSFSCFPLSRSLTFFSSRG